MKCYLFILLTFSMIVGGCSGVKPIVKKPEYTLPVIKAKTIDLARGKVAMVKVDYSLAWGEVEFLCDSKPAGFDHVEGFVRAYVAVPYEMSEGQITCAYRFKNDPKGREVPALIIAAKDHPYPFETLKVSKKHVDLSPEDLARWQSEVKELERVYSEGIIDRALFETPFKNPLKSKITSFYGKRRVFNNKKEAVHKGVDYRAWTGTPIPTSNKGKVVFAGELFFNGGTVIIDHGLGIMTMYCHLSKVQATVGEIVPQGAIIGLSGNTGRSTAPHLHWGVRVSGEWVDGITLIQSGI